jgi:hypothetical protein
LSSVRGRVRLSIGSLFDDSTMRVVWEMEKPLYFGTNLGWRLNRFVLDINIFFKKNLTENCSVSIVKKCRLSSSVKRRVRGDT